LQIIYNTKTTTNKPFINIYNYPAKEGNNITITTTTSGITLVPTGNQNSPDLNVAQYQYLINYNKNSPSTYTLYVKLNPNPNIPNYNDYSFELAIYDNSTGSFVYTYKIYNQSQLLSSPFTLNTKDNYSIYAVYFIPVNVTTNMLGSKFKFSTIGWTTVPYEITNSFSNSTYPYQSAVNNYTQTFFILPPKDLTIYNYTQNGNPILESGFWNKNGQFINNQTILGSYGNPYSCLLYGGISQCIGFGQFIMTNPLIYLPSENYKFNSAYAVPAIDEQNGQNLYLVTPVRSEYGANPQINLEQIYGIFYTNVSNNTRYANPIQGYFYPNYLFYNSSVSLNQYFNSYQGAVMQINADFGYYIPIYQATGIKSRFGGNCDTSPNTIFNLVSNSTNIDDCYNYIEDNLTLALSPQAIQINIPNYIYHWYQYYYYYDFNGTTFYAYERWNATNDGITNILIEKNQSTMFHNLQNGIKIIPEIPTSGNQTNVFAFYDEMINNTAPYYYLPVPPPPTINN